VYFIQRYIHNDAETEARCGRHRACDSIQMFPDWSLIGLKIYSICVCITLYNSEYDEQCAYEQEHVHSIFENEKNSLNIQVVNYRPFDTFRCHLKRWVKQRLQWNTIYCWFVSCGGDSPNPFFVASQLVIFYNIEYRHYVCLWIYVYILEIQYFLSATHGLICKKRDILKL